MALHTSPRASPRFEISTLAFPRASVLTPFPRLPLIRRTPYVTGTTVLGLKYKDGVMIACDTLGASRDETRSRPRSSSENQPAFVDGVSSNRGGEQP